MSAGARGLASRRQRSVDGAMKARHLAGGEDLTRRWNKLVVADGLPHAGIGSDDVASRESAGEVVNVIAIASVGDSSRHRGQSGAQESLIAERGHVGQFVGLGELLCSCSTRRRRTRPRASGDRPRRVV
jgi:hypothetical protein